MPAHLTRLSLCASVLLTLTGQAASAQWTVTNLHPAAASESYSAGVGQGTTGVKQVGYVTIGGAPHASLWSGTAASWTDLHPAGSPGSLAFGISGPLQAGAFYAGNVPFASTWSGTAASMQMINTGATSTAYGVSNGLVVGTFNTGPTTASAGEWVGTTRTTLSGTSAYGVDGTSRVGTVRTGSFPIYGTLAVLWVGTPATTISLHPAGAYYSSAAGVGGNQQVGKVTLGTMAGPVHASLWTGSAASWIDLNPVGASSSECSGVSGGQQVGTVQIVNPADPFSTVARAGLWSGTAASWVNLHTHLPNSFHDSYAKGIWTSGNTTYITGYGFNTATNRNEALLWTSTTQPACGSSDFNGDGDFGTDADIEAFFACLGGACCPSCGSADFNNDGDTGTDADIEAFFRVLAGGNC